MVVSRSIVAITIKVSGQNCVMGNHDINILKLIARVGELEFIVEKGSMHVCPKGVIERIGKILLGNFGGDFHYVEESSLEMFWGCKCWQNALSHDVGVPGRWHCKTCPTVVSGG